jgi:PPOX class probable F420-dependent enzyme
MPIVLRLSPHAVHLIRSTRIAHLATADASGRPHVVPICFIFDGKHFYSPIDEKPKRVTTSKLKRLRNIRENTRVALVIDRYDENWAKLAYVLVTGRARIMLGGIKHREAVALLRRKYAQYRSMNIVRLPMIVITPKKLTAWAAT